MSSQTASKHRARRFSAGTAFCIVATASIVALAWSDRTSSEQAAIDFNLLDDEVVPAPGRPLSRPTAPEDPVASARAYLDQLSTSGDARYLRYASATLAAARVDSASTEVAVLEARLLQAEHFFDAAVDVLYGVLEAQPGHKEALLLLADSLLRAGRVDEARAACLNLALAGSPLLAKWCAIQVVQAIDLASKAHAAAQELLTSLTDLPVEAQPWALHVAADAALQTGHHNQALALFERASAAYRTTLAQRIAHADLLIATGRFADVGALLGEDGDNLSAQVRLAIAKKSLGKIVSTENIRRIEVRFTAAAEESGNHANDRDRAIWALRFRDDPESALEFARQNWASQKGSEDLALLREIAEVVGDRETLASLERWIVANRHGTRS